VESPAVAASVHEAARSEEHKPAEMKSGLEEALLSSLPQDVTAEEIAAIKAAAAAFSSPSDESTFAPHRNQVEAPTQDPVVTGEELPRESGSESISIAPQAESSATAEQTPIADAVSASYLPTETTPPAMFVSESPVSPASEVTDTGTGKLADDEVTAALASLAPTNGHGDATFDREPDKWEFGSRDQVPVTMAVRDAMQEFSGPRWIAEPVALREDEATLVLAQEMEKAYAAFAAADAACMSFASSPEPYASLPVAEAPAANPEAAYAPVESSSNSNSFESQPQEPAAHTTAMSSEESEAPEAESSAAAASPQVDAVSDSSVSELPESAAYAAAASASSSTADAKMDAEAIAQPSPLAESSESVAAAPEPSEGHGESELVAAWANWKQIRESVIGSQLTSQIADTVAEVKEQSSEPQPESQPGASSATEEETSEISNIVDSVLADLKPKLMAEIARKMGKEKKK
jgi:hypothetical protein